MATNKRAGNHSAQQNDFLSPLAVTIVSATNVGTNRPYLLTGNGTAGQGGAVNLSWTLPANSPAVSVYEITSTPATATHTTSSTSHTFEGLASNTSYTFTVTGYNGANVGTPVNSISVLVTTVPATPAQPTATSPGPGYDTVSWTAPANGGSAITNYHVTGNDGTSGDTSGTTINISQGMGETQAYTVYATNANGNSGTSPLSSNVTTTFSFAPFGFTPFSFTPFGAFGFTPFGAFSFAPFGAFSFAPFGFFCVGENTEILAIGEENILSLVAAKDLKVGDKVASPIWTEYAISATQDIEWSRVDYGSMSNATIQDGIVIAIDKNTVDRVVYINNDKTNAYTQSHPVLAKIAGKTIAWDQVKNLAIGDSIFKYDASSDKYVDMLITNLEIDYVEQDVYTITVNDTETFIAGGIISHK